MFPIFMKRSNFCLLSFTNLPQPYLSTYHIYTHIHRIESNKAIRAGNRRTAPETKTVTLSFAYAPSKGDPSNREKPH
jgi:hypothetical protein